MKFREAMAGFRAVRRPVTLAALAVAVTALVALAGSAALAQSNQFKRIRDISVICTEALTCDLQAYNTRSPLYSVAFRRAAAPDAPLTLVLGVRETLAGGSEVDFFVDGGKVLSAPVSDMHYRAAVYEYNYTNRDAVDALLEAVEHGDSLRIAYRARSTQTTTTFSLAGFTEGLRYLDEVQSRVGRPDALVTSGSAPAGADAMRRIAALSDVPFPLRGEFGDGDQSRCAGTGSADFAAGDGFEADTGGGASLIGVPCGEGTIDNRPYAFWERRDGQYSAVPLPVMTQEGPSTDGIAWNVEWDQEGRTLTGVHTQSAIGDCGTFDRWLWQERDGRNAFVLVEARAKPTCDGDPAGGPANWPLVWPPKG